MIKVIGDHKKIVSEINITPLVDTLLVLLIIFMVTAPAMTRSVGIELPERSGNDSFCWNRTT